MVKKITPEKAPAISAEQAAIKRADEEKARQEAEALSRAQTAFARQVRFEKLARKNPMIAEIVEALKAKEEALAAANKRISELESLLKA